METALKDYIAFQPVKDLLLLPDSFAAVGALVEWKQSKNACLQRQEDLFKTTCAGACITQLKRKISSLTDDSVELSAKDAISKLGAEHEQIASGRRKRRRGPCKIRKTYHRKAGDSLTLDRKKEIETCWPSVTICFGSTGGLHHLLPAILSFLGNFSCLMPLKRVGHPKRTKSVEQLCINSFSKLPSEIHF